MRRGTHTALGFGVLPYAEVDRPAPDDPEVQRIAQEIGIPASVIADAAEETMLEIFRRTGERAPLEDVLAALEVTIVEARQERSRTA